MTTQAHEPGWVPRDTLAIRLALVRRELGLSQRAMAERCGLGYGDVQSIEAGRQARGLDVKVAKVAIATGVNRDWLMWGQQSPQQNQGPDGGEGLPRLDSNQQPVGLRGRWRAVSAGRIGRRAYLDPALCLEAA